GLERRHDLGDRQAAERGDGTKDIRRDHAAGRLEGGSRIDGPLDYRGDKRRGVAGREDVLTRRTQRIQRTQSRKFLSTTQMARGIFSPRLVDRAAPLRPLFPLCPWFFHSASSRAYFA